MDDLRANGKQKGGGQIGAHAAVRLTDLFTLADIRQDTPPALGRTDVVANATDGYQALLSWGALYNAPGGKTFGMAQGALCWRHKRMTDPAPAYQVAVKD